MHDTHTHTHSLTVLLCLLVLLVHPSIHACLMQVEATKFTELGFVGRDVDEIVKDLVEASLALTRTRLAEALREVADRAAEDIILAAVTGSDSEDMKGQFRLVVQQRMGIRGSRHQGRVRVTGSLARLQSAGAGRAHTMQRLQPTSSVLSAVGYVVTCL